MIRNKVLQAERLLELAYVLTKGAPSIKFHIKIMKGVPPEGVPLELSPKPRKSDGISLFSKCQTQPESSKFDDLSRFL